MYAIVVYNVMHVHKSDANEGHLLTCLKRLLKTSLS